jgi:hypothetical protein
MNIERKEFLPKSKESHTTGTEMNQRLSEFGRPLEIKCSSAKHDEARRVLRVYVPGIKKELIK